MKLVCIGKAVAIVVDKEVVSNGSMRFLHVHFESENYTRHSINPDHS